MNQADLIWNRAAMEDGGKTPSRGDVALSSLLHAHGLVMNGGVLHAAELLTGKELLAAQQGYCFYGLGAVGELLLHARRLVDEGVEIAPFEPKLDAEYQRQIPSDSALTVRFKQHLRSHSMDFSSL